MKRAAFLFPGQLSEWIGMGRDFYDEDADARALFALTSQRCGRDLERLMFEGPEDALHENLAAQAAVYLVSTLASRALE
ncbi:MAG: malonyl CoA-acyl carrier protein transacylase, partial [Thermoanaerobaculia bacterium]